MCDFRLHFSQDCVFLKPLKYGISMDIDKLIFVLFSLFTDNQILKLKNSCFLILLEQSYDVVAVGQNDQAEHQDEADDFGHFHELVAGLAPRDDFDKEEEDVTTVQARDGQDVHHGEGHGEEGRHAPEDAPNPLVGEDLADGDEAAHALVSLGLGAEDKLHLLPIVAQLVEGLGEACRNGLPEGVFLGLNIIIIRKIHPTIGSNHTFLVQVHGQSKRVGIAHHLDFDILVLELLDILYKILIIRRL